MATKIEEKKWMLYLKRREALMRYGFKKGLIKPYSEEFIESLRTVYYGGIPASILLLSKKTCNGKCYDRALLATFGCGDDDFQLVDADIDGITLNPKFVDEYKSTLQENNANEHYGNHCFLERTTKDGTVWVYDTTWGLVFEKNLYYEIEHPKVTKINDRKATEAYIEYQEIKNADIEKDKYVLPALLPLIEAVAETETGPYKKLLQIEIELFKQNIGYQAICEKVKQELDALRDKRQYIKTAF